MVMSHPKDRADKSSPSVPKLPIDKLQTSRERFNRASADFLNVDLDTALTFSGIALQSQDIVKKRRNRQSARRAYDTVLRLAAGVTFTDKEAKVMGHKLQRLKSELKTLGESF
jgi:hypothetical protein